MNEAREQGEAAANGNTPPTGLRLRCHGTRGSIPTPGPTTIHYGGNTPCVEVQAGGHRLIFDAGTGIRGLGVELEAARAGRRSADGASEASTGRDPLRATLFLTHFHWDHVHGFPFFLPLWSSDTRLEVVGPVQTSSSGGEIGVRDLMAELMRPAYFPVPMSQLSGLADFGHLNEGAWERGDLTVRAMRVRHPAFTVGYRVDFAGRSIAYVPDNELLSEAYPVGLDWRARFEGFLSGVDVLVHDAMYTEAEYAEWAGRGHSTYRQSMDLAHAVGAGELVFFHHDPMRTDDDLDELLDLARNDLLAEGRTFGVRMAREGEWVGAT